MHLKNVSILGMGVIDAPEIVKSSDLEEMLRPVAERFGANAHLLSGLTGIIERRFFAADVMPSHAAACAAAAALEDAEVSRDKIGVLINTSVCQDYLEPSTAAMVHGHLGLSAGCLNFDVRNACLGFINAMQLAGTMIDAGQVEYALIVDGENSRLPVTRTIERLLRPGTTQEQYREQYATLTLGSGGVAMVLGRTDKVTRKPPHRVVGGVSLAASAHNGLCIGNTDEMKTNAGQLLTAGLGLAWSTWQLAQAQLGWTADNIHEFVVHQVSEVHTAKLAGMLGADLSRLYKLYPTYGNIGPAGIPTVLKKSLDAGRIKEGHRVALLGIGSGLNCAMMEVQW
jgi:acyl-CoA:acyl-CoA alkyltransferase